MRLVTSLTLCLAAALSSGFIAVTAGAQGSTVLEPGTFVRVTHPGEGLRTGTVVELAPDTLRVRWESSSDTASVPVAQITRLEVSRGQHRPHMIRDVGIGLLAGAGAGILFSTAIDQPLRSLWHRLGALAGAGVGAALNARPREQWEGVRLGASRANLGLVLPDVGQQGFGLTAAVSF